MPTLQDSLNTRNNALAELKSATAALHSAIETATDKNGAGAGIADLAVSVAEAAEVYASYESIEYPTLTVDDVVYEILYPEFTWEGIKMTAEDLSEDEETAAAMLEAGSKVIRMKIRADFSWDPQEPTAGEIITFSDRGVNAISWAWEFLLPESDPDTSTDQNPFYQYAEAGEYMVKLTVTFANNEERVVEKRVTVAIAPE